MKYRRFRRSGATYFFTVVTHDRKPLFSHRANVDILREVIAHVKATHPFRSDAFALMPDHYHCIWTLPDDDHNFSMRWQLIKTRFRRRYSALHGVVSAQVWQKRFWEHWIRDEDDFANHVDYIHINPVKHGLVACPGDWPYSSYKTFEERGFYPKGWGEGVEFPEGVGGE